MAGFSAAAMGLGIACRMERSQGKWPMVCSVVASSLAALVKGALKSGYSTYSNERAKA